ncbi:MAG: hypothetical protein HMLKMBBP_03261 [Planctomycetes bacterium]|nr:hypothetical protein [Planctomycetota bacterium]
MGSGVAIGAFAVLAALAAGFVAGMTFGGGDAGPESRAGGAAPTAETQQDGAPSPDLPKRRTDAPARAGAASRVSAAKLAAAAAEAADVPVSEGDGVIRGSCRTADGAPAAGVEVILTVQQPQAWRDEAFARPLDQLAIEDRVRRFVRDQRFLDATRRRVVTGPDGTFAFDALADGEYFVSANSDTHNFSRGGRGGPWKPGAVVDLVAGGEAALLLDVRLPDGTQPASAQVNLRQTSSSWGTGWTASQPRIWVAPGTWTVAVTGGQDGRYSAELGEVVVSHERQAAALVVQLKGRVGIAGRAKRPSGWTSLPCNWHTQPLPPGADEPADSELVAAMQGRSAMHRFGVGGTESSNETQTFWDLAPGRHLLACAFDGGPVARRVVEVKDSLVEVELEVGPPAADRLLEVTVTAQDGTPARTVTFAFERTTDEWSERYQASRAVSRGPGAWTVIRPVPGQRTQSSGGKRRPKADEGRWWLVANGAGATARADVTGRSGATIRLESPMHVVAAVTGLPPGRSWAIMPMRVETGGGLTSTGGSTTFKSGETPRIGPLEPGEYELVVSASGSGRGFSGASVASARVTVTSGDANVAIAVPPLHTVRIDGGKDLAGNHAFVSRKTSGTSHFGGTSAELDTEGRATLPDLPEGEYNVHLGSGRAFTIRIPETLVIRPQQ